MDSVNLTPGPLRRIDLRGTTLSAAGLRGALPRGGVDVDAVVLGYTRVPGLPVTLALDADGKVVDRVIGEISGAELSTLLDSLAEQE